MRGNHYVRSVAVGCVWCYLAVATLSFVAGQTTVTSHLFAPESFSQLVESTMLALPIPSPTTAGTSFSSMSVDSPSPVLLESQSETLVETASPTPVETLVETASPTPVETLVETASPTPVETLVETASPTSVEILVETEAPTPVETLVETEAPTAMAPTPVETPVVETQVEAASPTPVETPVETSSEMPSGTPGPVQTSMAVPLVLTIIAANLSEEFVGSGDCSCDLLVGKCDVYCCCDIQDCTGSEIASFVCSEDSSLGVECLSSEDIFRTSLPPCTCSNPDLLCVQTDNNPSRLQYGDPVFPENSEQFFSQVVLYGRPGDQPLLHVEQEMYRSIYQVGNPVLILQDSGELGFLSLPSELNGLSCHDGNPVTYLIDETFTCERSLETFPTSCPMLQSLNPLNTFQSFSVLQHPVDFTTFDPSTVDVVPVSLEEVKCRDLEGAPVSCAGELAAPVYNADQDICTGVLLDAVYTLVHNGTGEVIEASVQLTVGDVRGSTATVVQMFGVIFNKVDISDLTLQRSGNPGYVDGHPVLAGSVSEDETIIVPVDNNMWLVVMSSSTTCMEGSDGVSVRFREDITTACTLNVDAQRVLNNCEALRECTLNLLTSMSLKTHVGKYGNSDPLDISQWVQILREGTSESENQEGSIGGVCQDVMTSLHIHVLYAYTGQFDSPQAIITGIRYVYTSEDIVVLCRGMYCSEATSTIPVTLQTSVTFTETSRGPSQGLKSTKNIVRQLPEDFLYPFFVSGEHNLLSCGAPTLLPFLVLSQVPLLFNL